MNWKRIVKSCVPPIAIDLLRSYKRSISPGYTWEGIYDHYKDVPENGLAFEGDVWVDSMRQLIEGELADRKKGINSADTVENILLPFLVSVVCAESRSVRILDFGGGLGETYLHVKTLSDKGCQIDYHIVETPRMCEQGIALFQNQQIHFHSRLPVGLSDVDVVYVSSALQYVEDYVDLLEKLSAYHPRFVLFVKLSSGDIPTYATAQKNVRGSTIPYWFINIETLTQIMRDGGYSLIFRSVLEREYNQDNFPEEYRLKRACNLLFTKGNRVTKA
jgi:putative methyltransferase (TIGR04325 family)